MKELHTLLFMLHIMVGSAALLLFWVPALAPKGGFNHRRFGQYYRHTMHLVAGSGALMALLVLAWPDVIKAEFYAQADNPGALTERIRTLWSLLLYLALISYMSVRHGFLVLSARQDRRCLRTPLHLILMLSLTLGGAVILYSGIMNSHTLSLIFGPLGGILGGSMLHYSLKRQVHPKEWLKEHIGGFIGSGIGAYTAFLAFGGRQILSELGQWQLIFWVGPGLIGGLFIAYMSTKYAAGSTKNKSP
ncbi:hypothetical protein HMF8227_02414 [Saliniradius amylolyticus]|uniref:DUF2306 domain-containing protein n=1 Tax=Saliniradius amylolyticus TaxID=2183582 RepID=A0A2S2E5D1_9ALTE|nr:hypothetical protein [Saliniradius amylolyticus]AWL12866.1 hypothetical protein HMF8227_02414 [Saliniradius amylolyticus]